MGSIFQHLLKKSLKRGELGHRKEKCDNWWGKFSHSGTVSRTVQIRCIATHTTRTHPRLCRLTRVTHAGHAGVAKAEVQYHTSNDLRNHLSNTNNMPLSVC